MILKMKISRVIIKERIITVKYSIKQAFNRLEFQAKKNLI